MQMPRVPLAVQPLLVDGACAFSLPAGAPSVLEPSQGAAGEAGGAPF